MDIQKMKHSNASNNNCSLLSHPSNNSNGWITDITRSYNNTQSDININMNRLQCHHHIDNIMIITLAFIINISNYALYNEEVIFRTDQNKINNTRKRTVKSAADQMIKENIDTL